MIHKYKTLLADVFLFQSKHAGTPEENGCQAVDAWWDLGLTSLWSRKDSKVLRKQDREHKCIKLYIYMHIYIYLLIHIIFEII